MFENTDEAHCNNTLRKQGVFLEITKEEYDSERKPTATISIKPQGGEILRKKRGRPKGKSSSAGSRTKASN